LGKIGDHRAVPMLIGSLKDQDFNVRSKAVEALGNIGDKQVVNELILVLNDSSSSVRSSAVEALGKIGDDKAACALAGRLTDPDIEVRERSKKVMKELEEKIRSDNKVTVPVSIIDITSKAEVGVKVPGSALGIDDEELSKKLAQLSKLSDIQYATDKITYQATVAEFRRIGKELCANGGDKRMQWIAQHLEKYGGRPQDCEMYWAGICGWTVKN
jgi:HEAT repeat protein